MRIPNITAILAGLALASPIPLAHAAPSATKGAIVGGVAGHMAGHHTKSGAVAGAMVGHHMKKKQMQHG